MGNAVSKLLLCSLTISAAEAAELFVPDNYSSIQDAIDAVLDQSGSIKSTTIPQSVVDEIVKRNIVNMSSKDSLWELSSSVRSRFSMFSRISERDLAEGEANALPFPTRATSCR